MSRKKKTRRRRVTRGFSLRFLIVQMVFLFLEISLLTEYSWINDLLDVMFFHDREPIFVLFLFLWIICNLILYRRQTKRLDSMISAAWELAEGEREELSLAPSLKKLQDELNLTKGRTLRSKQDASDAEQKKNDLIMYLAHDLKTPLTSVIGYLTLLCDNPELSTEKKAEYAGIALEKAERLEELIGEFFDITRLTLTTMQLQLERRSLSRMLEQLLYEFQPILEENGHSWEASVQPEVEFFFDADKMERVMENLIRNALSYSFAGSPLCLTMKADRREVHITLMNQGPTIPEEKLQRLFEQFYRLDTARSTNTGGAGLGLAIAKEIVELHGGRISAASHDQQIIFTVDLPLRKS